MMKTIVRFIFWSVVTLIVVGGGDLLLRHATPSHPAAKTAQQFYVDFRQRLLTLWHPRSIETVIEKQAEPTAPVKDPKEPVRYLYKDQQGQLQFADSLEQVPPSLRSTAEPMDAEK